MIPVSIMREIKVMIFRGDIAKLSESKFMNIVQMDAFRRPNGMAVQQYSYTCSLQRDRVGTIYGDPQSVVFDFSVCVMKAQQNVFYQKLMEQSAERFSFLFNAMFENDRLKAFDNAIMTEGYIVDVEEAGSNGDEQAILRVKLLAGKMTYLHKNNDKLTLSIIGQ